MIGIWALAAYLAVILLWTTVFRRSVGEAMILGFLAVCLVAVWWIFRSGWKLKA